MVEGGAACMKYTLFFFNLLFFILGGVVLGIGLWVLLDEASFTKLFEKGTADVQTDINVEGILKTSPYVMIVCGGFVFVLAFLGCCGAIKEWRPLLLGYSFILFIILAALIAAGVVAAMARTDVEDGVGRFLEETLQKEYLGDDAAEKNDVTKLWDIMMVQFECCGVNGPGDFLNLPAYRWIHVNDSSQKVPRTCCILTNKDEYLKSAGSDAPALKDESCLTAPTSAETTWTDGCKPKLIDFVNNFALIVMGVAIGIACTLLLGIIFACCLCKAIGKQQMQV